MRPGYNYGYQSGYTHGGRGSSPPPPVYVGRSSTSMDRQHQGSPMKERAVYPTSPRSTSPLDRYYGTSRVDRPMVDRPLMKERPSVMSENPYSLGATSYKAASGYGARVPQTYNRGGYSPTTSTERAYTPTTPTKQRTTPATSFNSGVYGVGGTPQPRYGSPTGTPRQRIRGTSFREDYTHSGMSPRTRMKRAPSMLGAPGTLMIPPQAPEDYGKYSVVLDLDETLIYAREGPLYARPGVDDLFNLLSKDVEAIAWTAGLRAYAQAVLLNIDKINAIKHCIYRHSKWFSGQAGYQKDLSLLGRPLDRTIIIENTPDCIRANRENGILVADYEGGEMPDNTIPRLAEFIKGLISSGMSVPKYLAQCSMLSKRSVPTDKGDFIECYWLDVNHLGSRSPRINRDLPADQRYSYSR